MKYDDLLYLKEDIIREYAAKRKGLSEQEVKDLFNCILKYINHKAEDSDEYAIDLPSIGTIYKQFKKEDIFSAKFDNMMFEKMLNPRSKINKSPKFLTEDLEKLAEWQNE